MLRSLKEFTSEYEYVNIAYVKPCIMYDNLRNAIGEEEFFNALSSYYEKYKFKNMCHSKSSKSRFNSIESS